MGVLKDWFKCEFEYTILDSQLEDLIDLIEIQSALFGLRFDRAGHLSKTIAMYYGNSVCMGIKKADLDLKHKNCIYFYINNTIKVANKSLNENDVPINEGTYYDDHKEFFKLLLKVI